MAYSVAATLHFVNLARREGVPWAALWAPRVQVAAGVIHSAHLVIGSFVTNTCPVTSLPFSLSLAGVTMSLGHAAISRRFSVAPIGVAVSPLALMFLVAAQFVGGESTAASGVSPTLLALHITANLIGVAFFVLAGLASVFYLVQERRLKVKKRGLGIGRLPALDALDRVEHRLLLAGFPLLTFGVVTGVVFMQQLSDMSTNALLRSALAYLCWLIVAGVLVLRSVAGWRGRRTAYGTLVGTACVMFIILAYVVRAGGVA